MKKISFFYGFKFISLTVLTVFVIFNFSWAQAQDFVQAQDVAEVSGRYEDEAIDDLHASQASDSIEALRSVEKSVFTGIEDVYLRNIKVRQPEVTGADLRSLFYTKWQYVLLLEAKRGFLTRPVTAHELRGSENQDDLTDLKNRARGIREISMGGILYTSPKDWVVWLNGSRLAPDALPHQIMDMKVSNEYVDLKWFDSYTNLIFPIRLRPHQRFNLDSRIFLPGAP